MGGDLAPGDEVYSGEDEGKAYDATPESMPPFHVVYFLELLESHVWVEELEFGGGTVFIKLGSPGLEGHGWEGTGYGLPFGDAEAGFLSESNT